MLLQKGPVTIHRDHRAGGEAQLCHLTALQFFSFSVRSLPQCLQRMASG